MCALVCRTRPCGTGRRCASRRLTACSALAGWRGPRGLGGGGRASHRELAGLEIGIRSGRHVGPPSWLVEWHVHLRGRASTTAHAWCVCPRPSGCITCTPRQVVRFCAASALGRRRLSAGVSALRLRIIGYAPLLCTHRRKETRGRNGVRRHLCGSGHVSCHGLQLILRSGPCSGKSVLERPPMVAPLQRALGGGWRHGKCAWLRGTEDVVARWRPKRRQHRQNRLHRL